jgi:hypothetical protein
MFVSRVLSPLRGNSRVGSCDDEAAVCGDHQAGLVVGRRIDGLQKALRNARRALDARLSVQRVVLERRALLDPMTFKWLKFASAERETDGLPD